MRRQRVGKAKRILCGSFYLFFLFYLGLMFLFLFFFLLNIMTYCVSRRPSSAVFLIHASRFLLFLSCGCSSIFDVISGYYDCYVLFLLCGVQMTRGFISFFKSNKKWGEKQRNISYICLLLWLMDVQNMKNKNIELLYIQGRTINKSNKSSGPHIFLYVYLNFG